MASPGLLEFNSALMRAMPANSHPQLSYLTGALSMSVYAVHGLVPKTRGPG